MIQRYIIQIDDLKDKLARSEETTGKYKKIMKEIAGSTHKILSASCEN